MKKWQKVTVIVGLVGALIVVSVSAFHNIQSAKHVAELEQKVEVLQEQLQESKLKYKMLYRDPIVREAIQSGG